MLISMTETEDDNKRILSLFLTALRKYSFFGSMQIFGSISRTRAIEAVQRIQENFPVPVAVSINYHELFCCSHLIVAVLFDACWTFWNNPGLHSTGSNYFRAGSTSGMLFLLIGTPLLFKSKTAVTGLVRLRTCLSVFHGS